MNYSGKLLVATPSLVDPNFRETVICLVHGNDENGVLGLILNRASDKTICELWQSVFQRNCTMESLLYLGGPVFGPLMALHSDAKFGEFEVVPGVHFTSDKTALEQLVENNDGNSCGNLRFFIGNAGWSEGQLAQEIADGTWYLAEATSELVFTDDTELWQCLIEAIGRNILSEILHINHFPDDPSLN